MAYGFDSQVSVAELIRCWKVSVRSKLTLLQCLEYNILQNLARPAYLHIIFIYSVNDIMFVFESDLSFPYRYF